LKNWAHRSKGKAPRKISFSRNTCVAQPITLQIIPIFPQEKIAIGGIKYKKSNITNQSIIQKYFFSPMSSQRGKMKNQHV
jgi:hypothetical protein